MALLALFLLVLLASVLTLVAPVLRLRDSPYASVARGAAIQATPVVLALGYLAIFGFETQTQVAAEPYVDLNGVVLVVLVLQLLATPLALRGSLVGPGSRAIYTVLSAGGVFGLAAMLVAIHASVPSGDARLLAKAQNNFLTNCVQRTLPTFKRSRAELERYCECAAREVVKELGVEGIRAIQSGTATAFELTLADMKALAGQSTCLLEQFGEK